MLYPFTTVTAKLTNVCQNKIIKILEYNQSLAITRRLHNELEASKIQWENMIKF
jgi:hypothetical protein